MCQVFHSQENIPSIISLLSQGGTPIYMYNSKKRHIHFPLKAGNISFQFAKYLLNYSVLFLWVIFCFLNVFAAFLAALSLKYLN